MDIIKLLTVFTVIVIVLKLKKPLFISIIAGIITTALLFQIDIITFFSTLLNVAINWDTISILLVFYIITFLQRMLEKRGSLNLAQQSLDRLFNNRRITASLAPLFLGLLPSASVVVICGEVVQKSVGDYLSTEEKAFVTSYYRHIPESILPTFSSIIIAINLTQGAVTVGSFMIGMLPMVIALAILGHIFYLRRIPKETRMPPSDNKWNDLLNLCKGSWPVVLIIGLILIFNIPVYIAAAISVLIFIFTDRFKLSELKLFVKSAFEANLLSARFLLCCLKMF